jgi:molecular chaperone DnaK
MAEDNKPLGRFVLDGILPAPRGVPQIEVTFDIDANGILHVSARDKGTGREQKITIQAGTGLSQDEIERMKRDAELHAEEDKRHRDEIELRNQADTLAYSAEKTIREAGENIPAEIRSDIEENIRKVREALSGEDDSAVRTAMNNLSEALQRAGSAVYGQPGPEPEIEDEGRPGEEGTVEGEYREV